MAKKRSFQNGINSDRLISQTFPELNLTTNQIFEAGVV
jgi:Uma2 family endonuclease